MVCIEAYQDIRCVINMQFMQLVYKICKIKIKVIHLLEYWLSQYYLEFKNSGWLYFYNQLFG